MSENREEILANFQSITAIEDVAEAIYHLDECNWDLLSAVHRVLPQDPQEQRSSTSASGTGGGGGGSGGSNIGSGGGAFASYSNNLNSMETSANVEELMTAPSSPVKSSAGGTAGSSAGSSHSRNLDMGASTSRSSSSNDFRSALNYLDVTPHDVVFRIHFNNDVHKITVPNTATVGELKAKICEKTAVPVCRQALKGWEPGKQKELQNSSTVLKSLNVGKEVNLILSDMTGEGFMADADSMPITIDSESSEEFEDASDFNNDDDIFTETPINSHLKHLIPDNVDDEAIGSIQFVENFVERYGPQHPMFFQGSLEDALKEACRPSARDRKLLAVYLHHDGSVLTNVFCGQLLACESIIQMLLDHFVLYGWDLTFESNKNMFLSSISACVGMTASITVRNIPADRLPAILVIAKNRSQCEVFQVIYGNVSVDDLLSQLMEASDMYAEQLKIELREENERLAREQVKLEQDAAYRESLEADRAKQEAKRQKEMMVQSERRRLESERADAEAKRELIRAQARITVPPEPEQTTGDNITKIRIRTPAGSMLERRFTTDTPLRILLNYITGEGFLVDEFKVISSWPRRDLTTLDYENTMKDLKLYPQETLILEER